MQGQRVAELAPQGAEQAATSHQVKATMKGEGRVWSAQALFPQLVSVIFHILAQCQNATTVQLGTAHLRHWPSFPQLPLQRSPLCSPVFAWLLTGDKFHPGGQRSSFWQTSNNNKYQNQQRKVLELWSGRTERGKENENEERADQEPKRLRKRKRH